MFTLRPARSADAPAIAQLVDAAYLPYVERIGFLPRPMRDDYVEVIQRQRVTVAEENDSVVGVIVLDQTVEGFVINNVAVAPTARGTGLGKTLLLFAENEARRAGFDSIYLYTHERMTENLELYQKIAYREYARRSHGDFSLVYLRKPLLPTRD